MHELLVDLAVIITGASLGCLFGVYLAEVLIFRKRREELQSEIDKRVQDLLDRGSVRETSGEDGVGVNLNMRV